jgi:hypothetical protein
MGKPRDTAPRVGRHGVRCGTAGDSLGVPGPLALRLSNTQAALDAVEELRIEWGLMAGSSPGPGVG